MGVLSFVTFGNMGYFETVNSHERSPRWGCCVRERLQQAGGGTAQDPPLASLLLPSILHLLLTGYIF